MAQYKILINSASEVVMLLDAGIITKEEARTFIPLPDNITVRIVR